MTFMSNEEVKRKVDIADKLYTAIDEVAEETGATRLEVSAFLMAYAERLLGLDMSTEVYMQMREEIEQALIKAFYGTQEAGQ